jgi:hypothetical protein
MITNPFPVVIMILAVIGAYLSHDPDLYLAAGRGVEHDRLLVIGELVNYFSRGGPGVSHARLSRRWEGSAYVGEMRQLW